MLLDLLLDLWLAAERNVRLRRLPRSLWRAVLVRLDRRFGYNATDGGAWCDDLKRLSTGV